MNIQRFFLLAFLVPSLMVAGGCGNGGHEDHDDHDDQSGHTDHDDREEAGGEHDDHDEQSDVIMLTDEQLANAGVVIEPLGGGEIATHIMLPAEVGFNEDAVVHVTPRVAGIVSVVEGLLGHQVQVGELLAVIESPELGETKIAYLQAIQVHVIAKSDLDRQRIISENTAKLLVLLADEPTLEELRVGASGLRIGENKGRLLTAYAQMKASNANYARENEMQSKGLSTQADLLASQEQFHSAQAQYMAAFEDVDFSYQLELQEAEQASMVASSAMENAGRRLYLLGLSEEQVEHVATDSDTDVARYELVSPMSGRIVSKHITPGEKVDDESSVYTVANLDTVWLNISVYAQFGGIIEEGQRVAVRVGDREASGVVDYISATVSEETRTIAARVLLENKDRAWKPGEFVMVQIETGYGRAERVVPIDAIQTFEGHQVVFVQDQDGIEPVVVVLGRKSDTHVELLGDEIVIGTPVVVVNSFLMKAELGKSSAGHQH